MNKEIPEEVNEEIKYFLYEWWNNLDMPSEEAARKLYQQFIEPLQKKIKHLEERLHYFSEAELEQTKKELKELREENDLKERQLIAATSRIKLLDEEIERLKAGVGTFMNWLKEKRPHSAGAGAPIAMLEGKVLDWEKVYEDYSDNYPHATKEHSWVFHWLIDRGYKLIQPQVEEGNKTKEEK
jgi:chromosome segregation ATPase